MVAPAPVPVSYPPHSVRPPSTGKRAILVGICLIAFMGCVVMACSAIFAWSAVTSHRSFDRYTADDVLREFKSHGLPVARSADVRSVGLYSGSERYAQEITGFSMRELMGNDPHNLHWHIATFKSERDMQAFRNSPAFHNPLYAPRVFIKDNVMLIFWYASDPDTLLYAPRYESVLNGMR
ncbi:MAG: hypothetical protein ACTHMJ_15390 [Thermomicrobiales bacterium]